MNKRENILMICSWLNFEKIIGACFWEQAVLSTRKFNMFLSHFEKEYFNWLSIFRYKRLFKIEVKISPNGIQTFFVSYPQFQFLSEKYNAILHKKAVELLYNYLKKSELNIDLVHAQSIFNGGFEAFYFKTLTRTPFVVTEHNQFTLRERSEYETKITSEVLSHAKKRLAVSYDKVRQFAANWFYNDFTVVGNAIDCDTFYYNKNTINKDDKIFKLVTTGAFAPIKDQKTILDALTILDNDRDIQKQIIFTWIGHNCWGQNRNNSLKELLNKYEFKNIEIRLFDLLDRAEVAHKLRQSDLFVFSSLSEGMPISVLEALASGIPVISTNCGGVDELINGGNGRLINLRDFNQMASEIKAIILEDNKFDRDIISKEIINKYGRKSFTKKMNKIYSDCLE